MGRSSWVYNTDYWQKTLWSKNQDWRVICQNNILHDIVIFKILFYLHLATAMQHQQPVTLTNQGSASGIPPSPLAAASTNQIPPSPLAVQHTRSPAVTIATVGQFIANTTTSLWTWWIVRFAPSKHVESWFLINFNLGSNHDNIQYIMKWL